MSEIISKTEHIAAVEEIRAEYLGRYLGAAAEIERLRAILEPFAAAVYNDNGNVTYDTSHIRPEAYWHAYVALRPSAQPRMEGK